MQSPEYKTYEELLEEVKNGPVNLNGFATHELHKMLETASGLTAAALRDVIDYRKTVHKLVARERMVCPHCNRKLPSPTP